MYFHRFVWVAPLLLLSLNACGAPNTAQALPTETVAPPTATTTPTPSATPTSTPTATPTVTPTPAPTATATPEPTTAPGYFKLPASTVSSHRINGTVYAAPNLRKGTQVTFVLDRHGNPVRDKINMCQIELLSDPNDQPWVDCAAVNAPTPIPVPTVRPALRTARIRIDNRTGQSLTVSLSGPMDLEQEIATGEHDVKLVPGTYDMTVRSTCGEETSTISVSPDLIWTTTYTCQFR